MNNTCSSILFFTLAWSKLGVVLIKCKTKIIGKHLKNQKKLSLVEYFYPTVDPTVNLVKIELFYRWINRWINRIAD